MTAAGGVHRLGGMKPLLLLILLGTLAAQDTGSHVVIRFRLAKPVTVENVRKALAVKYPDVSVLGMVEAGPFDKKAVKEFDLFEARAPGDRAEVMRDHIAQQFSGRMPAGPFEELAANEVPENPRLFAKEPREAGTGLVLWMVGEPQVPTVERELDEALKALLTADDFGRPLYDFSMIGGGAKTEGFVRCRLLLWKGDTEKDGQLVAKVRARILTWARGGRLKIADDPFLSMGLLAPEAAARQRELERQLRVQGGMVGEFGVDDARLGEREKLQSLRHSAEVVRMRLKGWGLKEALVTLGSELVVAVPGASAHSWTDVERLLGSPGEFSVREVASEQVHAGWRQTGKVPEGHDVMACSNPPGDRAYLGKQVLLRSKPILAGADVVRAEAKSLEIGWVVEADLTKEAGTALDEAAGRLFKQEPRGLVAFVIDGTVVGMPVVMTDRFGGRLTIAPGLWDETAMKQLAATLTSGKLPVRLKPVRQFGYPVQEEAPGK